MILADQDLAEARQRLEYMNEWLAEKKPLMAQLKFTPWHEIPRAAKDRIMVMVDQLQQEEARRSCHPATSAR